MLSMGDLVLVYKKNRQWKEAGKSFMQVIEIRKRIRGAGHLDTLSSMAK